MMHHDPAVPETARLLMNSVAYGTVMSVDLSDPAAPRAVVNVNSLQSAPMPWIARRAGPDSEWWAPEVGEQVAVICAYGDTVQGIILGSIYQANFPAPSQSPDVWRKQFKDGTWIQYDRAAHVLTVDATASNGTVIVNCQTATMNCKDATINASEEITLATPLVHCTQALTVDGVLTYKDGMVGSGGTGATAQITGDVQATGTVTGSNDVVGGGKSLKGHTHPDPQGGNTGPPN